MENQRLATAVLAALGGADNVAALRYCASRVRLKLHDNTQIDRQLIEQQPPVRALLEVTLAPQLTEFQLVMGPGQARPLYQALIELVGEK
ncbi:PTS transporter subunit EIIB [Erwinia sp. S38]|uniref:PTS transporter subunit EIIB n=1 Tax=Erwinia sp. S38 TaxID=2769338 RepID=UPI00190DDCD8|nr:PTS transporter subunit EIIB [Erwinia sp. S38]MBK0001947.1 PTS transporter subunit EIIB [Erwinia sp. S38]